MEGMQQVGVEAGADLAGVDQFFPAIVADEDRAESLPAVFRRRKTADDELLLVDVLHLQPLSGTPVGFVKGAGLFEDDALESLFLRLGEEDTRLDLEDGGQAQGRLRFAD